MKLIIAGGRDFGNRLKPDDTPDHEQNLKDYTKLHYEACKFIEEVDPPNIEIISGLARGADQLGCQFASDMGYPLRGFAAEWGKFGRAAGPIRNKLMAKNATHLLAFWDGKSRGTMHMIDYATKMGLKIKVVEYEKN